MAYISTSLADRTSIRGVSCRWDGHQGNGHQEDGGIEVGRGRVGRPRKQPSQVINQPAIHRFFGTVNINNKDDRNEEGGDRANRRGEVDEIEDKESSDEDRFILPNNDEPDDTVESEGSDSTETERLPAQKKNRVISDDSDDDGFMIQYESVTGEDGGRDSGRDGGRDSGSDRIVTKLMKK